MLENRYEIIVAGGGHAGIEAALASSRMGIKTLLITLDISGIARMSCNPAIGGLAKGHLVKEIDALGGIMSIASDKNTLQMKTLNKSKGRAVWSSRAQIDKITYPKFIQQKLEGDDNITIIEDEVINIDTNNATMSSVNTKGGLKISCMCLIVTAGTFMNGVIHIGNRHFCAGRMGERPSAGLTESLVDHGFVARRLKTGTPPRISKSSIDLSAFELASGDTNPIPFSIEASVDDVNKNMDCYIAYTNQDTHKILTDNIELSAIHQGNISGSGPRYCPSIEDKVVRFSKRPQHQLFLEQEWEGSDQLYVNGFSTSMPEKIQKKAIRSVQGLSSARFIRPGYAIEYDYIPTSQLKSSLESKEISGLFLAGQLNGTSGYEEAAAQGLLAGINAACFVKALAPLVLERSESYIGVLIDDLITQEITEPYRMFTSSAEHRLWLRPDNVYDRLFNKAANLGLLTKARYKTVVRHIDNKKNIISLLCETKVKDTQGVVGLANNILKKPDENIQNFIPQVDALNQYNQQDLFSAETDIKYEGYVKNEWKRVEQIKSLNSFRIPKQINYNTIQNLSSEARESLQAIKPETLGQASRISGVRQSDLSILAVYITKF